MLVTDGKEKNVIQQYPCIPRGICLKDYVNGNKKFYVNPISERHSLKDLI